MALVVNVRDEKCDVYVGRGTVWGNPFILGVHGNREEVIQKYRRHLWNQIKNGEVSASQILDLDGLKLGCHCHPLPCHADVILNAIDWAKKELTKREV